MLAREGILPLALLGAMALGAGFACGPYWSLPLWGLMALLLRVFHFPKRNIPALPLAVLAAVDGRVEAMAQTGEPYLQKPLRRLRMQLPLPGITSLRSPAEGTVREVWLGEALPDEPRQIQYAVWIQTDEGDDIVFRLIGSAPYLRCRFTFSPGERVGQGQPCGFVYWARRFELLVPVTSCFEVCVGERVKAGSGVLATLVRD